MRPRRLTVTAVNPSTLAGVLVELNNGGRLLDVDELDAALVASVPADRLAAARRLIAQKRARNV